MNNIDGFHSRIMGVMRFFVTFAVLLWFGVLMSLADTHYVAQGGQTPVPDYTDWTTAASNIQDAIDIAATVAGDTILVSNGVYQTGGIKYTGVALTNRVWIRKGIIVRSANNEPTNTIIKGEWASDGSTNGADAIRCVYMTVNSSLIGFTLTNGATLAAGDAADRRGGGVSSTLGDTNVTISNCVIIGNRSLDNGGGVEARYGITLYNCTITSNSASGGTGHGGGVMGGTLYNCTLSYNSARYGGGGVRDATLSNCSLIANASLGNGQGGGARDSTLYNCTLISNASVTGGGSEGGNSVLSNCTLTANYASSSGGGASGGTLYNCTLISNSVANLGGGVSGGTLYNCTLISNRTTSTGGGAYLGTLYNCTLIGNYAAVSGGGTRESTLYNCTVVNNSADPGGTGGALNGTLYNTILYFNTSGSESNYSGTICFTNSCTAPTKAGWAANNITNVPVFMNTNTSNYRLSSDSPCINTGTNFSWMTDDSITSKDLDGRMRIRYGTVDMGAYEHTHAGTIYGFH